MSSTQLESISAQVEAGLERGKNVWSEWRAEAGERAKSARALVEARPWPAVVGAAVAGLLLGFLLTRVRR